MRGLAILSVVIQHFTFNFDNQFVYHRLIGISNMALFFFVSGYILCKTTNLSSINDVLFFLRKKTIQLLLPLIVYQLLVVPYFFNAMPIVPNWQFIADIFFAPKLWFLLTLYGYMFAFAIYNALLKNKSGWVKIAWWIFIDIVLAVLWKYTGEFQLSVLYLPYFAAGVLFASGMCSRLMSSCIVSAVCLFIVCFITCFWSSGHTSLPNILIKIIVSLSVIQLTYNICLKMHWCVLFDKFIKESSINSLAIYIIHWTFLPLFLVKPVLPQNELFAFLICTLSAVVISSACILLKRIVALFPIADLLLFGVMPKKKS